LQEILAEHALTAVAIDDALIEGEIWRGGIDGPLRNACRECFCLECVKPRIEAAGVAAERALRMRLACDECEADIGQHEQGPRAHSQPSTKPHDHLSGTDRFLHHNSRALEKENDDTR